MPRKPRRVQARKDSGYKVVHRPSKWGNPYPVEEFGREEAMRLYAIWLDERIAEEPDFLKPLRGHNLGCFCPPEKACHADIILERLYGSAGMA